LTVPFLEDADDIAPGEDVNVIIFPDVIVKVTGFSPYNVLYESAPYNNIPNLKRIDLCLPKSSLPGPSTCFNGNLIGSLGNVFLGGNQNTGASSAPALLRRYGDGNFLEADGKISVGSALALFSVECAAWAGVIDMKGCMYDAAKPVVQNTLKYYTIRIRRDTTSDWQFVTENYKHPRFSKRNLPNYIGDDVGPFPTSLHVDGGPLVSVPAYKSIQREIFVDGIDWEFSNSDRFIQLNTGLYDALSGVTTPGTFYARVDGYDTGGNLIPNATDMIALFVHNLPLNFGLAGPSFADTSIVYAGCNLYRLTAAQMNTPMQLSFEANDPYGFVDKYELTVGRCPTPLLLHLNFPNPGDMLAGETRLFHGEATTNVHDPTGGIGRWMDQEHRILHHLVIYTVRVQAGNEWVQLWTEWGVFGKQQYQSRTTDAMTGISTQGFILSMLAVWRVTHLLACEDGPFDLIFKLKKISGQGFFGNLLDCFYCLSLWIAVPFAILLSADWTARTVAWLALSGGASFLFKMTERSPDT
jgi:hypothetical protein